MARCQKKNNSNLMSESEVEQLIMYFERITRSNLKEMPARADILIELDKRHQIFSISEKG